MWLILKASLLNILSSNTEPAGGFCEDCWCAVVSCWRAPGVPAGYISGILWKLWRRPKYQNTRQYFTQVECRAILLLDGPPISRLPTPVYSLVSKNLKQIFLKFWWTMISFRNKYRSVQELRSSSKLFRYFWFNFLDEVNFEFIVEKVWFGLVWIVGLDKQTK